jgi:hypothetical protein
MPPGRRGWKWVKPPAGVWATRAAACASGACGSWVALVVAGPRVRGRGGLGESGE